MVSSSDSACRSSRSNWPTFHISRTAAGIGSPSSNGENQFRRVALHDLVHNEYRQIVEQMYVIDTHHHRGARRCGRQRLDHSPQQLNGIGDTRRRPRGESTERNRPRRRCSDRPPAFASLRLSSRQGLTGDPALPTPAAPLTTIPEASEAKMAAPIAPISSERPINGQDKRTSKAYGAGAAI